MAKTVGEQLKETRTQRGLTLEQAAQATRIRKHFLEALESNQRDQLPSVVQGRGFLRLYAGYLNLPAAPLLEAWDGKKPLDESLLVEKVPEAVIEAVLPPDVPVEEITPSVALVEPAASLPQSDEALPPEEEDAGPIPVEFQSAEPVEQVKGGSLAIFREIGQKLREQREILGLSRAEVERYTRLRQHYLQALEDGRIDLLPSPVQGRGMLSNYAAFLNLNEDAILLRFAEGLQLRRVERLPSPPPEPLLNKKRPARPVSPLRRLLTPDLIVGTVVVLGILAFAIGTAANISTQQARRAQPTAPGIAEVLMTPGAEGATTPGATASLSVAEGTQTTQIAGEANPEETPNSSEATGPASSDPNAALPLITDTPIVQPTLAPINTDPIQIYIVARQRAYLRIIVDGKEKFNGRVVPGNAYAFSGVQRIDLTTGNAAALQVFYNQDDLGTLGLTGQVVALAFESQTGVMTATPAPSITPTPGPPVTTTPTATEVLLPTPTVTPYVP